MFRWLLYLIPSFIVTALCYLLNPIVVLFCDELGELHGFLKKFQTWDDSCDSSFFMNDVVPVNFKMLDYGFNDYYESFTGTDEELAAVGRDRIFNRFKESHPPFTLKKRIQRYFCRILWLTRNCAYGFCFWDFGTICKPSSIKWLVKEDHFRVGYDSSQGNSIWTAPFSIKLDSQINKYLRWKIYIGWKLPYGYSEEQNKTGVRSMLAYRALIKITPNN